MNMENLKKVVGFGLSAGEAIVSSLGQSTALGKGMVFLKLVEDLPGLVGVDYAALKEEVKGLTPEQLSDLNMFIDNNFSIDDKEKEQKIEAALSIVIDLAKLVEKAIAVWGPKPSI